MSCHWIYVLSLVAFSENSRELGSRPFCLIKLY